MSRFEIRTTNGNLYAYGYDHPLQQYFLDESTTDEDGKHLCFMPWVGYDSPKPEWNYGTRTALCEAMERFGIWELIPESHRNAIALDMPIPEDGLTPRQRLQGRDDSVVKSHMTAEEYAENERQFDPEPHGSRDTFVPRPKRVPLKRVPFVPQSEGPDGEQFNAMQD